MHVSALPGAQPARHAANAAGVAAILLWASLALMTATAQGLPPFQLLAASFGVAFALSAVLLTARRAWGRLRAPAGAWLLAVGGIFGYHALYFYALGNAPVAEASLIAYLWPLLIVLFALRGPAARGAGARWPAPPWVSRAPRCWSGSAPAARPGRTRAPMAISPPWAARSSGRDTRRSIAAMPTCPAT
ncbi:DMT family transporter [Bordetella bronchiseptica]|uniref:DMT family transporter n=1 Tax=Bordetella bronchiseptica TaxID=518 RepID=UPI000A71FFDD|nr:DMT family transporter [Bordetella bronchiseptica]